MMNCDDEYYWSSLTCCKKLSLCFYFSFDLKHFVKVQSMLGVLVRFGQVHYNRKFFESLVKTTFSRIILDLSEKRIVKTIYSFRNHGFYYKFTLDVDENNDEQYVRFYSGRNLLDLLCRFTLTKNDFLLFYVHSKYMFAENALRIVDDWKTLIPL